MACTSSPETEKQGSILKLCLTYQGVNASRFSNLFKFAKYFNEIILAFSRFLTHWLVQRTSIFSKKNLTPCSQCDGHYFEQGTMVIGEFHMDQMDPHSDLYRSIVDLPSF